MYTETLTPTETCIVRCICDENLTAVETAKRNRVTTQCIKGHVQIIYDKLGIKRNLQALTKWYFTVGEGARRIGAAVLLLIFSFEVISMNMEGRLLRSRTCRRRNDDIEVVDMEDFI